MYTRRMWEAWLEEVLFPLALGAAGLPASTRAEEVLARPRDVIRCYEDVAEVHCEELLAVQAAELAARHAGSARSGALRDAIVHLAMTAAHELAVADDLLAIVPEGCGLPADCLDRRWAAALVVDRWRALDAPIRLALARAGLALEG